MKEDGTFPEEALFTSETNLELYHANDMTYNPKINRLIVSHGSDDKNTLSIINPETLTVESTKTLDFGFATIAYNEKRDRYVCAISGTRYICIMDNDFNLINQYKAEVTDPKLVTTATTGQGMSCDDNYLYFTFYDSTNRDIDVSTTTQIHAITVFDWDGNRIKEIAFSLPIADMKNEPENISVVGDTIYMEVNVAPGINNNKYSGNYLYTLDLETN